MSTVQLAEATLQPAEPSANPSSIPELAAQAAVAHLHAVAIEPPQDRNDPLPPIPWRSYKERLASLAQRSRRAASELGVLPYLRWTPEVEQRFFACRCRELPQLGPEQWASQELGFDAAARVQELESLAREVETELGPDDELGAILIATVLDIRDQVRMIAARGTRQLGTISRSLYGSPKDPLPHAGMLVRDAARVQYERLQTVAHSPFIPRQRPCLTAEQAAEELARRYATFFGDDQVLVVVDTDVTAEAAAATDRVKLREGAMFSQQDLDVLEVHEGWVHVATSLNGQSQPVARWLAKPTARTTATQEGLAVLTELLTGRCHVQRACKLSHRVLAIDKAEDGASFLDVFEWYRTEGYDEQECFRQTRRVFRGGWLHGGAPFTKDVAYVKGLGQCMGFVQQALACGRLDWITTLFAGKAALDDVPVLADHVADGLVREPLHVPPVFRDPGAVATLISLVGGLLGAYDLDGGSGGREMRSQATPEASMNSRDTSFSGPANSSGVPAAATCP